MRFGCRFIPVWVCLWLLGGILGAPAVVLAQVPPPPAERPPLRVAPPGIPPEALLPEQEAEIRADSLVEDAERGLIVGEGFVEVRYLHNVLQADRVEIDTETGDGVAIGNVIFEDRESRLVCDRLEFNLRSQQGLLYGVHGQLGGVYNITAPRMDRLDQKRYRIHQGGFTTCSGPVPLWTFGSQSAFVELEGHAFINQPTFWVLGVPVAYIPYLVVPIRTERASGLLVPTIGFGGRDGYRYGQDFFWAFSDHGDATVGVDYRTRRGFAPKGEFRYRLGAETLGSLDAKFLSDDLTNESFYRFRGNHEQEFSEDFRAFYRAEWVNRGDFDQELEQDLGLRTRNRVESIVNVEKNWDAASARFTGLFQDSTEKIQDDFFRRFPQLEFNLSPSAWDLGPIGVATSLGTSAIQFSRRQDQIEDRIWRLDLRPRVSIPFSGLGWLSFTPFAEARGTFYSRGRNSNGNEVASFSRELWQTGASAEGPRLFRTFDTGVERVPAIRHLATTRFTYTFRPDIDREDRGQIVPFDGVDEISPTNSIQYTWEHRFLARVEKEDGVFETQDVLDITLSQSLNLNEFTESTGGRQRRPLSDLTLSTQFRPFSLWRLGFSASYDIYDEIVESYRISVDVRQGRAWFLRFEDSFNNRTDELFISAAGGIRLFDVWHAETNLIWDGDQRELLEQDYRLRFQSCCWGFDLGIQDRPQETVFFFSFNLVGVFGAADAPIFQFGGSETSP